MVEKYNVVQQTLFLRMMLTNAELYVRVMNIMNPDNFDKSLRPVANFFKEHMEKYNLLPDSAQVVAVTGIEIEPVTEFEQGHYDWFLDEFEKFTRRQELERAILKSADLLEKGDYNPVEKLIKDAVQISLTKDMGTDYFADPRGRLLQLKNNNGQISTGWPCMDQKLYGGFNRGELNIFAGGSGSGKSLFMQNLAVNWSQAGLNGAYISLELSEELSAMRIDSMMTDTGSKEIFKNIDDVEMKVKMLAKKSGGLQIKYLPAQSTVNDLRSYCKELEVKTKKKLDFLCVDYLDLLMPVSAKVSPSDLFIKDKYVSEELRNLAKELRVLFVTASQLNRSAVEEIQFDHSHISGGISKINTADNVFGIFTSRHMREKGQYQLQLMKTRSSSGVGQNIELAFDLNTLRITDPDPEGSNSYRPAPQPSGNDIMSRLKPSSTVTSVNEKIHETIEPGEKRVEGSALNARINTLLKNNRR
jgi:KaiC/GvpD/RAD55 family RecA-like ATPase